MTTDEGLPHPAGGAPEAGIGHDAPMSDDPDSVSSEKPQRRKPGWMAARVRGTDSRPQLVATAKFIRRLLPGDDRYGDALTTGGDRVPERIGRLVSEAQAE